MCVIRVVDRYVLFRNTCALPGGGIITLLMCSKTCFTTLHSRFGNDY